MKKIILAAVLIISTMALLLGACSSEAEVPELKVATSTSLLAYIVQQVGGDEVEVINIVPPSHHPGNFDVTPGDIQKLADAPIFLTHGWPGEGYVDKIVASANNPNLTVNKVVVNGNWMIPSFQNEATGKVAQVLGQADSKNAADYQKAAADYQKRINAKETDIKTRLANAKVSQVNVIASARQADFLQWAGLNVVATFNAGDMSNPQTIQKLVDTGKEKQVTLIINNLQDGADTGKGLATELGVPQINLSNFPGGLGNTETWEKAINCNVDLIIKAIEVK